MPLLIDSNGKTRLLAMPKPYPPIWRMAKYPALQAWGPLPEEVQFPSIKTIDFQLVSSRESGDELIYEASEPVF